MGEAGSLGLGNQLAGLSPRRSSWVMLGKSRLFFQPLTLFVLKGESGGVGESFLSLPPDLAYISFLRGVDQVKLSNQRGDRCHIREPSWPLFELGHVKPSNRLLLPEKMKVSLLTPAQVSALSFAVPFTLPLPASALSPGKARRS